MKKIIVLMSAYNGQKFINEQLDSVLSQKNVNLSICIRDDGSTDATKQILKEYDENYDNITIIYGENCGAAISFWKLISMADSADYYAFCDQDDIWMPDKLEQAVKELERFPNSEPSIYYSQTKLVDENGNAIICNVSDYQKTIPSFGQLVAENNATGCTMVWNECLNNIAKKVKPDYIRMHDHLLYLICQACDGNVVNDSSSYIYYRQHGNNVIGGRNDLKKYFKSIKRFLREDSGLAEQALQLKKLDKEVISEHNMQILNLLHSYKRKNCGIRNRIRVIKLVKQDSVFKNIMIAGLVLLNRF